MRAQHLYIILALLLAAAMATGCGRKELYNFALPSPYAIQGKVVDTHGNPIRDVPVLLTNSPTTRIVITLTDGNGAYQFEGLAGEDYSVIPRREGSRFSPGKRSVSPKQIPSQGINFTLLAE